MPKLIAIVFILCYLYSASGFICPNQPITYMSVGGNLPAGATNITLIPKGTNCTFTFDIPSNYALQLKFSVDFQSVDDSVQLIDNREASRSLLHTGEVVYDAPVWLSPTSAKVIVIGNSGNSRFMMSYLYQSLKSFNDFKQVTKRTGEHFPLVDFGSKTYYTITASSDNEKVVLSPALRAGVKVDIRLQEYYVYDGDNINTANMIGALSDFYGKIVTSSGRNITIVNFYGTVSASYVLGNDASTLNGYSNYLVGITTLGSSLNGRLIDFTESTGIAYTMICIDCSTFYWTKLQFDSLWTISNKGYITFQGQTPTHKREKLIQYDAFTKDSLPQMIPTNVLTINVKMSAIEYNCNTINDDSSWRKPYIGRKGYIFAPNLWTPFINNFNYEFRDDSQLYNFTVNFIKASFAANSDQMTLEIGSGTGNPALNNTYPRDRSSGTVMSNGNYMQVGLSASVATDVRLSFEMQKPNLGSAIGILSLCAWILIYYL
ncbi:hypothetical protein L3Y34_005885 [Caenorhabditis briggsae]|uniref:CUB-like domain-containing protein n=1 Tax=Caenorhabditis briggsae TaxID=6238 RepID=A0AAE8ZY32_CAEBR|nr:hypothetical protein L3Y34_005885 [Caenorhabditis briggsae]